MLGHGQPADQPRADLVGGAPVQDLPGLGGDVGQRLPARRFLRCHAGSPKVARWMVA